MPVTMIEVPATLRVFVSSDLAELQKQKLIQALVSDTSPTIDYGLVDELLKEHVSVSEPGLSNALLGSDVWINPVNETVEHEINNYCQQAKKIDSNEVKKMMKASFDKAEFESGFVVADIDADVKIETTDLSIMATQKFTCFNHGEEDLQMNGLLRVSIHQHILEISYNCEGCEIKVTNLETLYHILSKQFEHLLIWEVD